MRLSILPALGLLSLFPLFGCQQSGLRGEGPIAAEERALGSFDRVELSGGFDVHLVVGEGSTINVQTNANLLPELRTEVVDGVLEIGWRRSVTNVGMPQLEIHTASLMGIEVSGAADLKVEGVDSDAFALHVSGSCHAEIRGRADDLQVAVSGVGEVDMSNLEARTVAVSISGSSHLSVAASETLDVSISGVGRLDYGGSPQVRSEISGSGTIVHASNEDW